MVLTVLTIAGSTYPVWLRLGMLRKPLVQQAGVDHTEGSLARQALKGAGIRGLNPKVFLLFLALPPQFTGPTGSWPVAGQIVTLRLVHVASCAVIYTGVGSGALAVLGTRPTAARTVIRFPALLDLEPGLSQIPTAMVGAYLEGSAHAFAMRTFAPGIGVAETRSAAA